MGNYECGFRVGKESLYEVRDEVMGENGDCWG